MSWQSGGAYGGSAIPGNNSAALLSSPMMRGLWLAMLSSMLSTPYTFGPPAAVPGTPPLPGAGAGSGDATAGGAGGVPGTVTPPPPGGPLGQAAASAAPSGPSPAAPPQQTFQQWLAQTYPGATGWSQVGPMATSGRGLFSGVQVGGANPNASTEWSAMFTPPAGASRSPYPLYVSGPSDMSAPFSAAPVSSQDQSREN